MVVIWKVQSAKHMLWIQFMSTSCEIALRWMPQDIFDDKSTLIQDMTWCCQATSHYLSQSSSRSVSPYAITRPEWVNIIVVQWLLFWYVQQPPKCPGVCVMFSLSEIKSWLILVLRPGNERCCYKSGLILVLRPANERRRYSVTTSLIGWAQS